MRLLFALILLLSFASAFGQGEKIIVATYRYSDNDRLKNITPFSDYLAKTCRCEVQTKSYESVGAMLEAMKNGEPSIVFMNTFGYLLLRENNSLYATAAALKVAKDKKSTYQSVIIVNKSVAVNSLEELKSKAASLSLLLVNPGSTSGNLVPRIELASQGMSDAEQSFKKVSYSKNHLLTLKEVAEGKADVGAFGSEEFDKVQKMDATLAGKVKLLWTSADIPLGPVVYKKELSKSVRHCLEEALLSLHEKNKIVLESIKGGWTEAIPADRYVKIGDHDYESWLKKANESAAMTIIKKFAQ